LAIARFPARDIFVPLLLAGALASFAWLQAGTRHGRPDAIRPVQLDTADYTLFSYATSEQTRRVAQAAEALHAAYGRVFTGMVSNKAPTPRLQMVLYATRSQFKAHNRSSPWAEAFYQYPRCHAYYDDNAANPYHWMVHEATHQLNREWAQLPLPKWINEGVASYFGTSRIDQGVLRPGDIDPNTYPTWWLPHFWLSGHLDRDLAQGRLIPLYALITGTGPDINQNVNLYYIEYWSLAHFLFEYDHGRHAAGFKALMKTRGSVDDFVRLIGPVDVIQHEWYAHLLQLRESLAPETTTVRLQPMPG
jgi:hypothetical protein